MQKDQEISIIRRAQQLKLSRSSLHRILRSDLHLFLYKMQLTQELMLNDHQKTSRIISSGNIPDVFQKSYKQNKSSDFWDTLYLHTKGNSLVRYLKFNVELHMVT